MSDDQDDEGLSVHELLAHHVLPGIALDDPIRYLDLMASPEAPEFISSLIQSVSDQLGEPPDFPPGSVEVHPLTIGDRPAVIVEMPEPQKMTQAYFTCLVADIDLSTAPPDEPESVSARYFTLEKSLAVVDGSQGTILGEWYDGGRCNLGPGPEPTIDAFIQAIERILEKGGFPDPKRRPQ